MPRNVPGFHYAVDELIVDETSGVDAICGLTRPAPSAASRCRPQSVDRIRVHRWHFDTPTRLPCAVLSRISMLALQRVHNLISGSSRAKKLVFFRTGVALFAQNLYNPITLILNRTRGYMIAIQVRDRGQMTLPKEIRAAYT